MRDKAGRMLGLLLNADKCRAEPISAEDVNYEPDCHGDVERSVVSRLRRSGPKDVDSNANSAGRSANSIS